MNYKDMLICACVSAASFNFAGGVVLAYSAILIPQLESEDSDIEVNREDISWIASVIGLVAPLGALFAGYSVDRVGRLHTIRVAVLPYIAGWVCLAMAHNVTALIIGRFLTGLGMAVGQHPSFVYITEVSRPDHRGALSCIAVSLTSLGMVAVYTMGALLPWRTISWLSSTFCLPPLILMSLWSPESPAWLVSQGRTQDALNSLTYLSKKDKRAGLAEQKLAELVEVHNSKQGRTDQKGSQLGKLLRALTTATTLKPLLLLTVIFILQQFSGIYCTMFYTVTFFEKIGTSINPYISTVGIGVVRVIMGLVTSILLRNFGRRPLFLISSLTMAIFIFSSGYLTREINEGRMEKNAMPVICILVYLTVGVMGLMSIPWIMTAELFSIEIRGMAHGLMVAIGNLIMFAALKIYPFLEDMLGGIYAVQWMFAGFSLAAAIFTFIFLPETHGMELSEIQEYFSKGYIYILRTPTEPNKSKNANIHEEETISLDTINKR